MFYFLFLFSSLCVASNGPSFLTGIENVNRCCSTQVDSISKCKSLLNYFNVSFAVKMHRKIFFLQFIRFDFVRIERSFALKHLENTCALRIKENQRRTEKIVICSNIYCVYASRRFIVDVKKCRCSLGRQR